MAPSGENLACQSEDILPNWSLDLQAGVIEINDREPAAFLRGINHRAIRREEQGQKMAPALEMLVVENRAADDREIAVAADEEMGENIDEIQ
jgi:hypothetical protein